MRSFACLTPNATQLTPRYRACSEQLRIASRESDVVDALVVARVSQLVLERGNMNKVNVALVSADEEMITSRVQR